jgi:surface antigen
MNFEQQKELTSLQNKYQNSRDVQNYVQDLNKMQFQFENDPSNVAKNIENMKNMPVSPVASRLLSIPDGESVPNTRSQCGQYVNDVLGTPSLFKDSIEDKMKVATDKEPQIGGAVVLSSTGKYAQYGHVGIVVGMDDKTITVKSSNRDGDGKISTDVLDRNYSRIKGYYNPTQKGAKTYNDNDIALL